MVKDFIKPVVVLAAICLVVSGALAVVNDVTKPIIEEAAAGRMQEAMMAIIPDAGGFEPIIDSYDFPPSVIEAYGTANGAGYVFIVGSNGFGGQMSVICGVGNDGAIIQAKALDHSETKGIGDYISNDADFLAQFAGKDSRFEGIDAVTGASISFRAFKSALEDALLAFDIVK